MNCSVPGIGLITVKEYPDSSHEKTVRKPTKRNSDMINVLMKPSTPDLGRSPKNDVPIPLFQRLRTIKHPHVSQVQKANKVIKSAMKSTIRDESSVGSNSRRGFSNYNSPLRKGLTVFFKDDNFKATSDG